MKSFSKILALGAVLAASSPLAFADSIVGSVGVDASAGTTTSFSDTYINFSNRFGLPTGMVNSSTGTFDGTNPIVPVGTGVTLQNLVFGTSGTMLLSSADFSFTVLSSTLESNYVAPDGSSSITVGGTGTFTETGYSATPGTFILQSSNSGATSLNITGTAAAVTPEPNSLVLMGTGLLAAAGMLFMRRRNADNLI